MPTTPRSSGFSTGSSPRLPRSDARRRCRWRLSRAFPLPEGRWSAQGPALDYGVGAEPRAQRVDGPFRSGPPRRLRVEEIAGEIRLGGRVQVGEAHAQEAVGTGARLVEKPAGGAVDAVGDLGRLAQA